MFMYISQAYFIQYLLLYFVAIVNNEFRPKPVGEGGKCGAISRFLFDWESVANSTDISLNKAVIRPYMQVINRLINENEAIPLNISVSLQLFHRNMPVNSSASSPIHHFVRTIDVTSNSDGWLELDITAPIQSIWSPTSMQLPIVEITLRMEVDCINHSKVPVQFINPAEVELYKVSRREKHTKLQPLLVIFLEDKVVKMKLKDENMLKEEEVMEASDGADISRTIANNARRRRSSTPTCAITDFTVNFTQLGLDNVVLPVTLNIGQCSGDCSHHAILEHNQASNHARIIANAKSLNDDGSFLSDNSTMYYQNHENPCCTPLTYAPAYILLKVSGSYKNQLYLNMIATRCLCK